MDSIGCANFPPRALTGSTAVLFATAAALGLAAPASAASDAFSGPDAVPHQLIVGFDSGSSGGEQRAAVKEAGATVGRRIQDENAAMVVADDPESVASQLVDDPSVRYVEPNYVLHEYQIPNDSLLAYQWHLINRGQTYGAAGADIHAKDAWDVTTGGNVTVAVIDSGVDYNHPDLVDNMWVNPNDPPNGIDDDHDGYVDDIHGVDTSTNSPDPMDGGNHGTHIAGIIGARGDNGIGVAGVNWNVKIMAIKAESANVQLNVSTSAAAVNYAVDHGAKVINASWGGPPFGQTLYEAVRRASDAGVTFVAGSGNDGVDIDASPTYPAAYDLPNVISVAATDKFDNLPSFSNYGVTSVDLAAPGAEIDSTVPPATKPSGYGVISGTSMAAPMVAGAAALYLSYKPGSSVAQVRDAILQSVDPLPSLAGKVATGGRLDIAKMVGWHAASPDKTTPSRFRLMRPRNRSSVSRRKVKFKWQASRDADANGIHSYEIYVDGNRVATVTDKDGRGGKDPPTRARVKLNVGKHRWYVVAADFDGNASHSRNTAKFKIRHK